MTSTGGANAQRLKKLEDDFNCGDPIDLTPYQNVLAMAGSMGFNSEVALEAALITGTTENMQLITDYILGSETEKKKKYEKKKQESTKEIKVSPEQEKAIDELKKLRREIQQEQHKLAQLDQEMTERKAVTKLEKCVEFMRGIIADEVITDAEMEALSAYRKTNDIDDATYTEAWKKHDMTLSDVEDLRRNMDDKGVNMCMLCKERPKDHCIFPCMHVVVCEQCANDVKTATGPGSGTCPACDEPFEKVQKVYID